MGGGVGAGDEPLTGSLLVPGGAVDLAGEKEALNRVTLQRAGELGGVQGIVFHRVAVASDPRLVHTRDRVDDTNLDVGREGSAQALNINLVTAPAFRFQKYGMAILVSEASNLVFDTWAVAGSRAFDGAVVHGRAMEIGADQVVGGRDRGGLIAAHLASSTDIVDDREWTAPGWRKLH
jgi:hypothetical protein